jgi:hypothetical protein
LNYTLITATNLQKEVLTDLYVGKKRFLDPQAILMKGNKKILGIMKSEDPIRA